MPSLSGGRQIKVRGFEVVVHSARLAADRHLCFVFVSDPFDRDGQLKIFKGHGVSSQAAEESTIKEALDFLDRRSPEGIASILTGRSTLHIAGRKVDIFCDTIGEGLFQAFPFLYRADGSRVLILQFHLEESIVGPTPATAVSECIRRLEEFFERGGGEAPRSVVEPS